MLPSVQLVLTSSKDNLKESGVEVVRAKSEPALKTLTSVGHVKTSNTKTNVPIKSSTQADKSEERPSDKLLRNIAPKPIAIVCMPDIRSVRENEIEITEKQESELKNADEINIKTVGVASVAKCEKDNEEEKIMLKKPNTTGRSPPKIVKKKPKQIRDLEKTLNCLLSDNEQIKDEKAFAFAQSYFLKVTETLHGKDDATYSEFMRTMNDFGNTIFDATELYKKVTKIFEKYPSLSEEFLAFLLPEQAMQCGKFMEYIMLTKMRSFCRKLELYYSKQPSQLRKIYSSLSTLASNNKATLDDLKNTILPLLRNNSLLVNMFLELMPTEAPHASSFTDYESMDFCSVDIHNPKQEDWFETVEVPPPVEDNMYGGEDCICPCHIPPEGKAKMRSGHCMSCGTKFIQGRVFIHSGSMLRPARVSFKEMRTKAIERLSVKNLKTRRKIDKKQAPPSGGKKNNASKGETTSGNASGVSNKISSPKTTRKAKGKSTNENPKKSSKALNAPKASHNKQLNNDKKISKPPRKRIKLITNGPENPSTSTSVKSPLVSSKKGAPQTGKGTKVDVKAPGKSAPQLPLQQTEPTRRAARSAARNVTLLNDSSQKPNRRNIGNSQKEETVSALTTVILTKKNKEGELSVKNKSTLSTTLTVTEDKEGTPNTLLPNSRNMEVESVVDSLLKGNVDRDNLMVKDVEMKNDAKSHSSTDKTTNLLKSKILCDEILSKRVVESTTFEKEENSSQEKMELEHCNEKILSENNTQVSDFTTLEPTHNESPEQFSFTPSEDSSSDVLDEVTHDNKTDDFSQSEGDDVKSETIELDNSIENVSSEDDKNILGSEDFPINSSSDSEEDGYPVDSEDTEELEGCSSSSQNDVNLDTLNEENLSCDTTNENTTNESDGTPWTRDEDKIILRTFQSVNNSELVFQKICHELPSRTAEEVRSRFLTLMSFLQKMADD